MLDALSRDRNPSNFTLHSYLTAQPFRRPTSAKEFNAFCISLCLFTFYAIGYRSVQFVRRGFCITGVAAVNSFARVLNHQDIYIVIHRKAVSLHHKCFAWLDTLDTSSRDRNLANFTLDSYLNIYIYIYILWYVQNWN